MPKATTQLPESCIYSFIDDASNFAMYFFEGQKLIHDLALTHNLKKSSFSYFRDSILGVMLMNPLLKPGETLGVFIDSESPYFRLKVELNDQGKTRALLFPEDFSEAPEKIDGVLRLSKLNKNQTTPYSSVLNLKKASTKDILNIALDQSYQVDALIQISETSDQSVMLFKLPPLSEKIAKAENIEQSDYSPSEYWIKKKKLINNIFSKGFTDGKKIVDSFSVDGVKYLSQKNITHTCNCSKDRMILGIKSLIASNPTEEVFPVGKSQLETRCDYCKTTYIITKNEVNTLLQ